MINSNPPVNEFNLHFKANIIDLLFWSKLANITPILFKCDKSFFFEDEKFYIIKNWSFHLFIPLDFNNSVLLIGFFKVGNNKIDFDLNNLLPNVNYEKYFDFKNIITNLDKINELIQCYNSFIDTHHFMWIDQQIVGEYLDSV